MDEMWRDIDGFSKYQVSRLGEVRNKESGKLIKPQMNSDGYYRIGLRTDDGRSVSRMVHKLVAEAFVHNPNPEKLTIVNHIDQDRQNARADNLEWVSSKENANHSDRNERISLSRELPINEYDRNGKYLRTWKSESRIGKYYNVSKDTVSHAMAFRTFVRGRYFRKWNGSIRDIDLSSRICKSELDDYSVFGEINQDDLFQAQSFDDKYEEIRKREMSSVGVTLPIMKADMAFLEEYTHKLEKVRKKKG